MNPIKPLTDEDILFRLHQRGWMGKHIHALANIGNFKGTTALMCAVRLNNIKSNNPIYPERDLIETLISKGVNINAVDKSKNTALWYAYNISDIQFLCENGIDVNYRKPLSHQSLLDEVLEALPYMDSKTILDPDSMMGIQKKKVREKIEMLIECGAEVDPVLRAEIRLRCNSPSKCEYWENCIAEALYKRERAKLELALSQASIVDSPKTRI